MAVENMSEEIVFDISAMNAAAEEGTRLLARIRNEICQLGERIQVEGIANPDPAIRRLLAVCGGYEALLRNLEAASRVYGAAIAAAEELADF